MCASITSLTLSRHVRGGNEPAPGDAEGWVLVSRKNKSRLAQLGSSHKSTKHEDISFGKFCARSLVSGKGQSSPKLSVSGSWSCISAQSALGPFVKVTGSALPGAACDSLVEEEFKDPEFCKRVAGLERMLRVRSRVNKSSGGSPLSVVGCERVDSQVSLLLASLILRVCFHIC